MAEQFAIVTGASAGIGYELAAICAHQGFDLLLAADRPEITTAAEQFRRHGVSVDALVFVRAADVAKIGFDAMS